ncbi:uncharacterized protein BO87DRAFT_203742 [Aspergillus neoniger CBS 115656]|uniref:Uncharacterized protein n=1 Tax=Aspergillus neoniger (strain CBS 115656) TaxID=1448310 RepID=A0A318Y5N7_ASPNB|nr:hypothetical protein BO87DRAFT_203742 [Aspergillus neoniger CBS 115656]PYH28787.1 hypothetical protein BO87DRAFT_203742 [Aspergillus neoniger CBS 115656]
MDKLSGLASKLSGGNKSGGDAQASGSSGNQGQEDYLDKGEYFFFFTRAPIILCCWFGLSRLEWNADIIALVGLDSVEQKFGGGKIDPQKMRSTNEKITDTARNQFESATGRKVPEKFSN